ncbi:MAG: flagellar hook-associated protein FlgL [Lachnospiraceae bacterium]|nr:flagellar hook-associated protein FlgL [Lachnospiraceae bacterium]
MRVTNKIMQNNTLYNINQNKVMQNNLQTQITTRKKINKPSDDPIVAIRALRLRSNLNQVSQYYERNIPDAEQWLEITESSIDTTVGVISGMIDEFRRGSKSSLTTSDRDVILESLKQYRSEVYATGDADYAGRMVFTGYRTDMKLSFQASETKEYTITEQLNNLAVDTFTYVYTGNLNTVNESTYDDNNIIKEQGITSSQVNRIRLAYNNLENGKPVIKQVTGYNADGTPKTQDLFNSITVKQKDSNPDPYVDINNNANAVYFIPETGELLLGKNAYDKVMGLDPETEITVEYKKSEWVTGDLRPEHYFYCESDDEDGNTVKYNESYLTEHGRNEKQVISYDVGFNQSLEINTTADEIFVHGIGRKVDELIDLIDKVENIDTVVKKLESMLDNNAYDQNQVEEKLATAKKAQAYLNETLQRSFESGITEFQNYLEKANSALTAVGNRSMRLELVENRLNAQKASFEELTSENEDADLEDLAVRLKSANLTYDASLAATGKMLSTTLLNYL